MRINNYTTKDYTELGRTYQLVLPLSLEGVVPDNDSVRLLSHKLEELYQNILSETGTKYRMNRSRVLPAYFLKSL